MSYAYNSRTWNLAQRGKEQRKADELRDREAVRERRDRHKRALLDKLKADRQARIAAREQLPLIVVDPLPPVVREQLDELRAGRWGTAAEQRAAQERRDRERAPLTSPELRQAGDR